MQLTNPKVREEVVDILRYWLDMGVDGFRCDVINLISKDQRYKNDPSMVLRGKKYYMNGPLLHEYLKMLYECAYKDYDVIIKAKKAGIWSVENYVFSFKWWKIVALCPGDKKENVLHFDSCKDIWSIKCDVALPCATQFELDEEDAKKLISNGVVGVFEGANMPCTLEASNLFIKNKVLYSPGKASNAGGVATSGLEIIQNTKNEKWSFEEVDHKLSEIMKNIFDNCCATAEKLGNKFDLVKGANNYSFEKLLTLLKL